MVVKQYLAKCTLNLKAKSAIRNLTVENKITDLFEMFVGVFFCLGFFVVVVGVF